MSDAWAMTHEQREAQRVFRDAVEGSGITPPCRLEPDMWDDILPDEQVSPNATRVARNHARELRSVRVFYAESKCLSCPFMLNECQGVKDAFPDIMGVIAGELRTNYPIEQEEVKAS